MKITWYGHSAFRVEFAGAVVLIDPFLSQNPSFKGSVEQVQAGVTHIVLTHGHGDHLGDTLPIAKATGARVIANADLGAWLSLRGLENVDEMGTGGTTNQGAFTITLVHALHSSATQTDDGVSHALGNPNGVILKAPGEKVLYHMGDTDIFGDMALINEIHRPEIGLVPIGDRFTMGGKVAALACRRFFDFSAIIPCHYGTFGLLDQTADTFVAGMGDQAGRVKAVPPGTVLEL
ncbi:metal-dependent hydrolase [Chthonobacter albigriseus]|uniref:metal-dependent hydrolase n=1 Tax=Chthonobacter albigriseus TaxID=1683161 RepID=UPI0015EED270|nr:metal-dependent hydrolase [Chthonobacter albigriseus]